MKKVEIPQAQVALTTTSGQMTVEGHLMLLSLASALIELQDNYTALESRVTALEP